jgi:hypothetical protein
MEVKRGQEFGLHDIVGDRSGEPSATFSMNVTISKDDTDVSNEQGLLFAKPGTCPPRLE